MIPLEKIYDDKFFSKRYKLHWRAPYVVQALRHLVVDWNSYIDVGCATGELLREAREKLGVENVCGIEGSDCCLPYAVTDNIYIRDLRHPFSLFKEKFDIATCFEVAEHIEKEYVDTFLDNLIRLSDLIVMSAAEPGQKGVHHVNCREKEYWVEKMMERGYMMSMTKTVMWTCSLLPFQHKKEMNSYYKNGMVFERMRDEN